MIGRGRQRITELMKKKRNRNEKENKEKKKMKAAVKLISNEQQKNDVSTILAVTDDGNDLIGDLPMKPPNTWNWLWHAILKMMRNKKCNSRNP